MSAKYHGRGNVTGTLAQARRGCHFFWCAAWLLLALAGCREVPLRRAWSFPTTPQTEIVIVRSWRAREAKIVTAQSGDHVTVSARPVYQPTGYHTREPDWSSVHPAEWPFAWQPATQEGALVLACLGEARFASHRYVLEELTITVPPQVKVQLERQELEPWPN